MPPAAAHQPKEIDRTLKKVDESLKALAAFRQRPEVAAGCGAKGKNAEELRRLLEALQRHHAELRRWSSGPAQQEQQQQQPGERWGLSKKVDEARVRIEREMKRLQDFERVVKGDSSLSRPPIKVVDNEEPNVDRERGDANCRKQQISSEVKVLVDQLLKEQTADTEIVDEFICKICQVHIVGQGPKLARCSHLFCGDCIATWFSTHPENQTWAQRAQAKGSVPCPVCKELLHEENDLFPVCADGRMESAFLWQMLSSLRITCANHVQCRADGECTWTGEYGGFQKHMRACNNAPWIEEEAEPPEEAVTEEEPPEEAPVVAESEPQTPWRQAPPTAPAEPEEVPDAWDEGLSDDAEEGAHGSAPSQAAAPPPDAWDDDFDDEEQEARPAAASSSSSSSAAAVPGAGAVPAVEAAEAEAHAAASSGGGGSSGSASLPGVEAPREVTACVEMAPDVPEVQTAISHMDPGGEAAPQLDWSALLVGQIGQLLELKMQERQHQPQQDQQDLLQQQQQQQQQDQPHKEQKQRKEKKQKQKQSNKQKQVSSADQVSSAEHADDSPVASGTNWKRPEMPIWAPPKLCAGDARPTPAGEPAKYPGLNFCPPLQVEYFRVHMQRFSPPVPDDFWMLDAAAIMAIITTKVFPSLFLVNLGAAPIAAGEDELRKKITGDHCSVMWPMGYSGLNFDPKFGHSGRDHLKGWPRAKIDGNAWSPDEFPAKLHEHLVPTDLDILKVDVDSFDCVFLNNTLAAGFKPKLIIIELSSWFPPPLKFMLRFEGTSGPDSPMLTGCSLQMAVDILKVYGYTLLQYTMEDGWFVQDQFADLFGELERDPYELYRAGNPNLFLGFDIMRQYMDIRELCNLHTQPQKMLEEMTGRIASWIGMQSSEFVKHSIYTLTV